MKKFSSIEKTADGKKRAAVAFSSWKTLWFNTGTLCNIECENCYIHSSPYNDDLVYISKDEVCTFLDELLQKGVMAEIGFTGGEPFMNPEIIPILQASLKRGFEILVLTNAMHPMQRKEISEQLTQLNKQYPKKLRLRVSIDSHDETHHDKERGKGAWKKAMAGVQWIAEQNIPLELAGRIALCHNEKEATIRARYQKTFSKIGINMDMQNTKNLVLFPEMEETTTTPEITEDCWQTLNKSPQDIMCSHSRMVVKRKGAKTPIVLACTLIAYDPRFEMGKTLTKSQSKVTLAHPHCARFCVLGGASCSAG